MPTEHPAPRRVTPRPDPAAADTTTLVAMDVLPEQPVAAPEPPPPPNYGYDVIESAQEA